jgi:hypothetical protein
MPTRILTLVSIATFVLGVVVSLLAKFDNPFFAYFFLFLCLPAWCIGAICSAVAGWTTGHWWAWVLCLANVSSIIALILLPRYIKWVY